MDQRLFEAARTGKVEAFHELLQENPLILENVALTSPETPLHIASKVGHLDFVREMLRLKPSFARELNQDGYSPMDIASANGYLNIVKELLMVDRELCRLKGRDQRIPLHYAAIKGRVEIVNDLLSTCPESAEDVTAQGETALHLAVINNKFEALRALVQCLETLKMEMVINRGDKEGNTVLHLMTFGKQLESIELLLSISTTVKVNARNAMGLTAMDVLDIMLSQSSTSPTQVELKEILRRAGAMRSQDLNAILPAASNEQVLTIGNTNQQVPPEPSRDWFKYFQFQLHRDSPNDTRNALLVVAALIATVTFQAGVSPPTGFLQEDSQSNQQNENTTDNRPKFSPGVGSGLASLGTLLGTLKPVFYMFLFWNTLGLSASISIIVYLTTRFPLQRELLVSIFSMMFTYGCSIGSIKSMGVVESLLFSIAALLPFVLRWLPRWGRQAWRCWS